MLSDPSSPIANFDSAAGMVRAIGRFLDGKDFRGLGSLPPGLEPAARVLNALPLTVRERIYTWSGWLEALAPRHLGHVRAEDISRWVVQQYPHRRYPGVVIGSASGALVHLCTALGIPWLPQTVLIPVARSGIHPDDPKAELEWGRKPGRALLEANPELQLHQMHDPNQDRLMVQRMSYFRVKRLRLGEVYEQFLRERLAPGAPVFLSECTLKWATTEVGDRHIFQHGALGGATPAEFHQGSPRVEEYLRRYNSPLRRWNPPETDADRPEAEWGFEEALRQDVERVADQRHHPIRRLVFDDPMMLSPLVADLYRWWYQERSMPTDRLLVESFILLEPWWTLRTGCVPFWMTFNMQPSAQLLEEYLDRTAPFDQINMMLFSHGVESVGLATIDRWQSILGRARKEGRFIGVDPRKFPRDFGVFHRYYTDLKRKITDRYPMPSPLTVDQLDQYLAQQQTRLAADAPARFARFLA